MFLSSSTVHVSFSSPPDLTLQPLQSSPVLLFSSSSRTLSTPSYPTLFPVFFFSPLLSLSYFLLLSLTFSSSRLLCPFFVILLVSASLAAYKSPLIAEHQAGAMMVPHVCVLNDQSVRLLGHFHFPAATVTRPPVRVWLRAELTCELIRSCVGRWTPSVCRRCGAASTPQDRNTTLMSSEHFNGTETTLQGLRNGTNSAQCDDEIIIISRCFG